MRHSASVVCNSPKLDTILFVFRWAIPSWLALEKRAWRWTSLSSSETQRRSVGPGKTKTGATKVFKHRRKRPWVPTLTGPFPNGQANAVSWLGTKNALNYCAQSANSFSWVLFVSSYTTAITFPHLPGSFTKLVRARETCIFYFANQKRRSYRWVEKTFGMLSAGAIQFAPRIFCFWLITMYRK